MSYPECILAKVKTLEAFNLSRIFVITSPEDVPNGNFLSVCFAFSSEMELICDHNVHQRERSDTPAKWSPRTVTKFSRIQEYLYVSKCNFLFDPLTNRFFIDGFPNNPDWPIGYFISRLGELMALKAPIAPIIIARDKEFDEVVELLRANTALLGMDSLFRIHLTRHT